MKFFLFLSFCFSFFFSQISFSNELCRDFPNNCDKGIKHSCIKLCNKCKECSGKTKLEYNYTGCNKTNPVYAPSCLYIGDLYFKTKIEFKRALEYYKKACIHGSDIACKKIIDEFHVYLLGIVLDCSQPNKTEACFLAGRILDQKKEVPPNIFISKDPYFYYQLSCPNNNNKFLRGCGIYGLNLLKSYNKDNSLCVIGKEYLENYEKDKYILESLYKNCLKNVIKKNNTQAGSEGSWFLN